MEGAKLRVYVPSGANNRTGQRPRGLPDGLDRPRERAHLEQPPGAHERGYRRQGPLPANAWVEYDVAAITAGGGPYSFVLATDNTDAVTFDSSEHRPASPSFSFTVRAPSVPRRAQRPCSASARSISRFWSLALRSRRLSTWSLPFARAISIFAREPLK